MLWAILFGSHVLISALLHLTENESDNETDNEKINGRENENCK